MMDFIDFLYVPHEIPTPKKLKALRAGDIDTLIQGFDFLVAIVVKRRLNRHHIRRADGSDWVVACRSRLWMALKADRQTSVKRLTKMLDNTCRNIARDRARRPDSLFDDAYNVPSAVPDISIPAECEPLAHLIMHENMTQAEMQADLGISRREFNELICALRCANADLHQRKTPPVERSKQYPIPRCGNFRGQRLHTPPFDANDGD